MTEQMSNEGLDVFAMCVAANVDAAAHTTNLLLDSKDRDIAELATTVVMLDTILSEATVIDRRTERRLMTVAGRIDSAYAIQKRSER